MKRRQERTNRLDLMLAGIQVDGVSMQFNRVESRNALQKVRAEKIHQAMVLERARAGIISPDEAAQELGYDSAFDPELLSSQPEVAQELRAKRRANAHGFSATYRFDRAAQRYRFKSSTIEIASEPGEADQDNVLKLLKKKAA